MEHNTPYPPLSKAPQLTLLPNVFHFGTLDEKQL